MSARNVAVQAVRRRGAMQKPRELEEFVDYLRARSIRDVLEIGGMKGGTMWAWSQVAKGRLVCIDKFVLEGRMEHAEDVGYELIEGDSHSEITRTRVTGKFDMLFIDGDHSYAGVRRDFELYAPLVRPGGIVALHDVSVELRWQVREQHDVVPYWNQVRRIFEHLEIFDPDGGDWGGIGVLLVPEDPEAAHAAMDAVARLGPFTPDDRVATVQYIPDPCDRCGSPMVPGEEVLCARCASA